MTTSSIAKVLALVSACGLALAAIADPPDPNAPVLGGPKVKELNTPGAARTFDGKPNGMRYAAPELPQPRYMEIIHSTLGPSAASSLQISAEQENKIRAAEKEFRDSQRKFMEDNRKQVDDLRKDAAENRPARGKKPAKAADDAMSPDAKPADPMQVDSSAPGAAMERARKLREGAPKASELQAKIWSYLTPEQQAEVKPKIDEALNKMMHDRAEKAAEKKTDKKLKDQKQREEQGQAGQPGKKGAKALEKFNEATPEQQAEMKAKLKARLDKMPADQKEKFLERLKAQGIDPVTLEKSADK